MTQYALGRLAKALYSGIVAMLSGLATILTGPAGFGSVTAGQWVTISLLALTAGGGTYALAGWAGPKINGGQK